MNDELLRLAERCEAATGPDMALDIAIENACVPQTGGPKKYLAQKYTASLDAAMTLVPELNGQAAYPQIERVGVDAWHAHLGYANKAKGATGRAQKPALALCAAALRSRAHPLEGE